MNNYFPTWWDTPITVFNKFTDPQTRIVKWYKTIILNCFWKDTGTKVTIGDTVLTSNELTCRIPQQNNYMSPGDWNNTPNDEMANYFTLAVGDIIIKGNVDDVIDEYLVGHRSTDIISKYKKLQGCMEVKKVSVNTSTGMLTPHYNVRGE